MLKLSLPQFKSWITLSEKIKDTRYLAGILSQYLMSVIVLSLEICILPLLRILRTIIFLVLQEHQSLLIMLEVERMLIYARHHRHLAINFIHIQLQMQSMMKMYCRFVLIILRQLSKMKLRIIRKKNRIGKCQLLTQRRRFQSQSELPRL